MSNESTSLAVHSAPKASDQLASFLGIDKGMMLNTLKAQCFTGKWPEEVTDEQLAAFVSTANVLQVNPLVPGMLYAFPSKNGGIVPVLGPDGVFKKLDEMVTSGKLIGFECVVFPEDVTLKPTHAVATIYRGKDLKPVTYTALFAEWTVQNSPVWNSKPRHMLWTRAIKQCARQVIHGLPMDAEEYAMSEMVNVTPQPAATTDAPPERPAPRPRATRGVRAATAEATPVEVVATPAETPQPAATVTPVPPAEQKHADLEPVAPEQPKLREGRHKLNEEETYECEIKVTEITTLLARLKGVPTPSVSIGCEGEYLSPFYHFNGATADGEKLTPLPIWKVGARYRVKLYNKKNLTSGNCVVRAESVTALEDVARNGAAELDEG